MARKELATSAAKIIVVNRPGVRDLDALEKEFQLHPLDVQGLFTAPKHSGSGRYSEYVTLSVVWPEVVNNCIQFSDAVFVIHPHSLAIITYHPSPILDAVIKVWQSQSKNDLRSPLDIVIEALSTISRSVETAASLAALDKVKITDLSKAITEAVSVAEKIGVPVNTDQHQRLALLQHRLKYAGDTLVTKTFPLRSPLQPQRRLHRFIRGYAVASAAVIVLVLVSLTH